MENLASFKKFAVYPDKNFTFHQSEIQSSSPKCHKGIKHILSQPNASLLFV